MSIVTKGLGTPSLMTKGYGSWKKAVKKIIEVASRVMPRKRQRVRYVIPVYGDLVVPVSYTIPVRGTKDFRKVWLILEDE